MPTKNNISMDSNERFRTINDLCTQDQVRTRKKYINSNYYTIKKYIGFFDRERLKSSCIGVLFQGNRETSFNEGFLVRSMCCYSQDGIDIPVQLDLVTQAFRRSNLKVNGIFRVNSVFEILQRFEDIVQRVARRELSREEGLATIMARFDVLDIAESYKATFKIFSPPIIPTSFVGIAAAISGIEDINDRKICTKAFVYGLPSQNRKLLENCVFICNYLYNDLQSQRNTRQMNLLGISMSMMPNLFRPRQYVNDVVALKKMSDFLLFVFLHYRYVFSLE